ncbi:NAD(P)/FAD-dependent oxidoreductase [Mycolicibacterium sp. PAM1]|uniref:FAD-dependent pyridine nucleotide-disulfide oxidoreductase n=1 Tax=Mycolicibacterium gilvum (strain PYR-GCK) TaxID=350054 RepID=A4TAB2_MYCGI|nr:NAD(P)/FAD-dependent oxidoreductase [Mycolicibacterium sp. PAM1]ABP45848.1 FAD-dependent pyridine nucleotide-disulfide oxidoreductase [Mycolicibacterium gilvum PYR-GCK]MBV5243537.1 NAD(P)/FAD-dependent oxidoreductase [Mycolicibacterium sp. PAM1]
MVEPQYDVIVVGAGFGGMGAAIQLKKMGYENILIVDREDDLGGTWHVNHYPGLAVDIPSPTYSYWFEPNPYWSRLYAPGSELKKYAEHVADKYDVRRHMRFNSPVDGARWDDDTESWQVALSGGETLTAKFLITATGYLSQPRKPEIPGIEDFAGRVLHSMDWDDSYSPAGERVGLIGTGATAVQLIPQLSKDAAALTVYQRTPIHVVPKIDFAIPPAMRRILARVPLMQRAFRASSDVGLEAMMILSVLNFKYFRKLNSVANWLSRALRFVSIRDKELRAKLTPQYEFGCKRPTYSNSYYRMFTKPNVHLQAAGIDHVEADGIVACDGTKTQIDTLVLCTGFDLWEANIPAIEIIGRDARNLGKWWRDYGFQAYQGVSIPSFPNFLSLAGPYASSGLSFFNTVEYQMRHMDRLFGELKRRNATTFEVTPEANAKFRDRMSKLLGKTVFGLGDCAGSRSYYFSPSGETLVRPASTHQTNRENDTFPLTDYTFA